MHDFAIARRHQVEEDFLRFLQQAHAAELRVLCRYEQVHQRESPAYSIFRAALYSHSVRHSDLKIKYNVSIS